MSDLIRCIDTKTGKEKYLPSKIVADKKHMAYYNLIVQDLKENKKNVETVLEGKSEDDEFQKVTEVKPKKERKPKPTE